MSLSTTNERKVECDAQRTLVTSEGAKWLFPRPAVWGKVISGRGEKGGSVCLPFSPREEGRRELPPLPSLPSPKWLFPRPRGPLSSQFAPTISIIPTSLVTSLRCASSLVVERKNLIFLFTKYSNCTFCCFPQSSCDRKIARWCKTQLYSNYFNLWPMCPPRRDGHYFKCK